MAAFREQVRAAASSGAANMPARREHWYGLHLSHFFDLCRTPCSNGEYGQVVSASQTNHDGMFAFFLTGADEGITAVTDEDAFTLFQTTSKVSPLLLSIVNRGRDRDAETSSAMNKHVQIEQRLKEHVSTTGLVHNLVETMRTSIGKKEALTVRSWSMKAKPLKH